MSKASITPKKNSVWKLFYYIINNNTFPPNLRSYSSCFFCVVLVYFSFHINFFPLKKLDFIITMICILADRFTYLAEFSTKPYKYVPYNTMMHNTRLCSHTRFKFRPPLFSLRSQNLLSGELSVQIYTFDIFY